MAYTTTVLAGARPRSTVLLTGFGPFPKVPVNLSAHLARRLARDASAAFPNVCFVAAILPTEWGKGPSLVAELHDQHRPILALHFGVASGSRGIRLETEALNFCRNAVDAVGALPPGRRLSANGPAARASSIPVLDIAAALDAKGYLASVSDNAGGYLCNAVLYHSLALADARNGAQAGFVHIPAVLTDVQLDEVAAASLEIIKIALETAPAETSLTLA